MTASLISGPRQVRMTRDAEGHRTYRVQHQVEVTSRLDGPSVVLNCPGLPVPGSFWSFGNDIDPWAFCTWDCEIEPHPGVKVGTPAKVWTVWHTFTTRPPDRQRSAGDFGGGAGGGVPSAPAGVENPLMEPFKVSGSFLKYQKEMAGVLNSAHEQVRGPQVEFEECMHQVRIEQNMLGPLLGYQLPSYLINRVNSAPLWGMPARTIRLSNVAWERLYYGVWLVYYRRVLEFDVNPDTFDRRVDDEGTKALNGEWNPTTGLWDVKEVDGWEGSTNPDPENPDHFIRFEDKKGNPSRVILNGAGVPYQPTGTGYLPKIAITAGTSSDVSGARISTLGRYHGPLTIGAGGEHWFVVASGGGLTRKAVLKFETAAAAEGCFVNMWAFNMLEVEVSNGPNVVNGKFISAAGGTSLTSDLLIQVSCPARPGGAGGTYDIRVDGSDLANRPGVIHVRRHAGANFLQLRIPTAF